MLGVLLSLLLMSGQPPEVLSDYNVPLPDDQRYLVEYSLELFEIDLDPAYIYTQMYKESRFTEDADNYSYGYMQIIPDYFYVYYYDLLENYPDFTDYVKIENNVYDPDSNIIIGIYMLRYLGIELGYGTVTPDNFTHVLTAYGKGIAGAEHHYRMHGTYESSYTRDYYRVLNVLMEERSLESLDWSMYEKGST